MVAFGNYQHRPFNTKLTSPSYVHQYIYISFFGDVVRCHNNSNNKIVFVLFFPLISNFSVPVLVHNLDGYCDYSGHECLKLCSFNCRSIKNCYPVIADLCNVHDIVLLQEHWLLPDELTVLHNIHSDFHSHALSAVDVSSNILTGRPYGGTAILYHLSLIHISEPTRPY